MKRQSLQNIASLFTRAQWQVFEEMMALYHLMPNGLHCSIQYLQKRTGRSKSTIIRTHKIIERNHLFHIQRRKCYGRFGRIRQMTNVYQPYKWLQKLFKSAYAHLFTGVSNQERKSYKIKEFLSNYKNSRLFSSSERDQEKKKRYIIEPDDPIEADFANFKGNAAKVAGGFMDFYKKKFGK